MAIEESFDRAFVKWMRHESASAFQCNRYVVWLAAADCKLNESAWCLVQLEILGWRYCQTKTTTTSLWWDSWIFVYSNFHTKYFWSCNSIIGHNVFAAAFYLRDEPSQKCVSSIIAIFIRFSWYHHIKSHSTNKRNKNICLMNNFDAKKALD